MQILSSLSGLQFSAASAGYAPTNSADVSAIASAYATGIGSSEASAIASAYAESAASGKLDSTAFSTVSGDFLTAHQSLAGYATEAYVDSSVSGKLDSTAFNSADFYSTSNPSSFVDSAYVDSAVSGKQDELTFAYDADSAISSINGSALAGGGGVTGDYVEKSSMAVTIGNGNTASNTAFVQGLRNSASNGSFAQGSYCRATGGSFAQGYSAVADGGSLAQGFYVSAKNYATALGTYNLKGDGDISTGESAAFVIGDGYDEDARHDLMVVTKDGEITMFSSTDDTAGTGIMSSIRAISAAAGGVDSATVSAIASSYAESAASSKADSSSLSSYALSGDVSGVIDTVSNNSASWAGGGGDYVEKSALNITIGTGTALKAFAVGAAIGISATGSNRGYAFGTSIVANNNTIAVGQNCSAEYNSQAFGQNVSAYDECMAAGYNISAKSRVTAFGRFNLNGNGNTSTGNSAAFVIGDGTAINKRHDLMVVTKDGEITMFSSTDDTAGTGIMSSIRAISAAAGGGGVDSATVSAIASSYAESAASGKLDSSAYNSADFYTTANESGYVDSAYVDSVVSAYQPTSAMSAYALSADVSGTVDLVSTQSANWGGSALALSAGPGISLTMVDNTLVISTAGT